MHPGVRRWLKYGPPTSPYDRFVLDLLHSRPNDLVLDNGAGNGRFTHQIASTGSEVVALDVNLTLLKSAKRIAGTNRNVHFVLADMTSLPFASVSFNKIICVHNLWYVAKYERAIKEMLRVSRPGGVIVADHLNLFDPRMITNVSYYHAMIGFLAGKTIVDAGRSHRTIMLPFKKMRTQAYSIIRYEPLQVVRGVMRLARRFVIVCVT